MQRCLYRAECREATNPSAFWEAQTGLLNECMDRLGLGRLSIFRMARSCFCTMSAPAGRWSRISCFRGLQRFSKSGREGSSPGCGCL